jgi:hypothetical protein|tara:strand:- start:6 stop:194 length:189 start_codon:yes stop_codon:yes gene_type:complete
MLSSGQVFIIVFFVATFIVTEITEKYIGDFLGQITTIYYHLYDSRKNPLNPFHKYLKNYSNK